MKLFSLVLISSGLVSSIGVSSRAIAQTYPAVAVTSFMDACLDQGRRSAPIVPHSVMNNICRCSINYIQERVSYADFQTLNPDNRQNQSPRQQQAQRVVDESINRCILKQVGG
ncbi:hypothetical protein RYO59_001317 [Thermosynechococcaceae cyanobacterium Okahandja]